jgi:ubiquinol-cytochrome c reductase iron-sulfur subunit
MSEVEKVYPAGLANSVERPIADPGIEPHRVRMTDKSEQAAKNAERAVAVMFLISIVGAIIAVWGFFAFPIIDGDLSATRNNALWMGLGMALSLLGIGFGAVHWAKTLMPDHEVSEDRHLARSSEENRAAAVEIIKLADGESGFTRRKLIRRTLYGALAFFPIPAIVIFGDLGPVVGDTLKHTMWRQGTRLTKDPTGIPIKASDVTVGSVFHVIPEGLNDLEHKLDEKAKAAVLLVRVNPGVLNEDPEKASWSYDGIVAYSKICTHVGCPVALYEQHTHHLLCPCHQSTFDLAEHCKVIFGPAARPLPQLPISVDSEGYLVAQSDFLEPVGPSFWDMRK